MTDRDFDLLLEEEITALPPTDELVADITPWRKAVGRILWGMALCGITFNFLLLNYILPAIGVTLMLLGFRTLRRENKWFLTGFIAAVIQAAYTVFTLILNATIWAQEFYDSPAALWLTGLGVCITILHALCVWGGFRAVRKQAGVEKNSRGFWLVVYYLLLSALALAELDATLVALGMLVVYILLLRSLWKYSHDLEDAGYTVQASPVRLSDGALSILLTAVIAIGIACGYVFFNQYPMEWTEQETISAEAEAVKTDLLELGFPADVLDDLADEDLLACTGAVDVISDTKEYNIGGGETVTYTVTGPDGYPETRREFAVRELLLTHVAVRLDAERDTWVIFHHFLWQEDPGFRGTEALQIWPASRQDGWNRASDYTGRVLCEQEGVTYSAPYYSLGAVTGTSNSVFWENEISTDGIAVFSLPRDGENCRGYVSYTIQVAVPGYIIDSWCNYYYRTTVPAFPNLGSADAVPIGMASNSDPFKMNVSALQMGYDVSDAIENSIYEYHIIGQ